jgi:Protein of unknown function (DUF3108)
MANWGVGVRVLGAIAGATLVAAAALAAPAADPPGDAIKFAAVLGGDPPTDAGTAKRLDIGTLDLPKPQGAAVMRIGYEVYVGGLHLASADMIAFVDHGHYTAASLITTKGLADSFASSSVRALSTGDVHGHIVIPRTYNSDTSAPDKRQLVGLQYAADTLPKAIDASPPYDLKRFPVLPDDQRHTVDPLSAALYIALGSSVLDGQKCNQVVPVFDGKRRYNLVFSDAQDDTISLGKGNFGNGKPVPAFRCKAAYVRVAGFKPPKPGHKPGDIPPIDVWLVPFPGTDFMVPVRMQASSQFGGIVARAVRLSVTPGRDPS